MTRQLYALVFLVAALIIVGIGSIFTVNQTQQALILQFGELQRVHLTPGLKLKIPFIQEVIFYDNRLLQFNLSALEVNASDQKRLVVDLFARYRIKDTVKFYRTIGQDIRNVETRLSGIVLDVMQQVIGRSPLSDMLSEKRSKIMNEILELMRQVTDEFGIDMVDVRIVRGDLPRENSEAIFSRMESERIQEAKLFRAQGDEQNQTIRAKADRERTVLLAEAQKTADMARGEGEAEATRIYAAAYGKNPKFFEVYRTLRAYEHVIKPEDTTLIMSPKDTAFLKYFGSILSEKAQ